MAVEYILPDMLIRDHMVDVPLDRSKPEGETIRVFAREVCDPARRRETLPLLAFLQGGPGGKSPRPSNGGPPWLAEALKTHRVILIDPRGTGRSSRIESATMDHFADGRAAADYLSLFRADSIVADCEYLRKTVFGGGRWQTLGQSYGGFLTLTYLSKAPEGLSACYVTGGLAGLGATADDVYRRTYPRVAEKNAAYYRRYPGGMPSASDGSPTISRPTRCGCPMAIVYPFAAFRPSASISAWRRVTRTSIGWSTRPSPVSMKTVSPIASSLR
nr:alpha/beta fold hydrolase [Rhizobium leguminosarum]